MKPVIVTAPSVAVEPPIVLALANGNDIEVVAITPAETKALRAASLPSTISDVTWVGDDPIVMMEHRPIEKCLMPEPFYKNADEYAREAKACEFDPKLDGVIGRLTAKGFVPFPPLPESTWSTLPPIGAQDHECVEGCWALRVVDDAIYQGHCKAAFSADGGEVCETWRYARIDKPGPAVEKIPEPAPRLRPRLTSPPVQETKAFVVAPSPRVTVALTNAVPPPKYEGDEPVPKRQLSCTLGGTTTTYPEIEQLDEGMGEHVEWITSEPPMFVAYHLHDGFVGFQDIVLFEGCVPHVINAIEHGPDDVIALDGATTLYRHGKLIGRTTGGMIVVFK